MERPHAPIIAAMPLRPTLVALLTASLCSCQLNPGPAPGTDLPVALAHFGNVETRWSGTGRPTVVVIRDRHPTHGAITRDRGRLYGVRRDNRAALGYLVSSGFTLVGVEAEFGPLPNSGPAARHRTAVREALEERDDLDALTVYQPIRYEEEFRGRLEVLGVEDAELYRRDVEALQEIIRLRTGMTRNDVDEAEQKRLRQQFQALGQGILSQVESRGRAAANNFLSLLAERGLDRGTLMLGGAHVPAAVLVLREHGASVLIFESTSYAASEAR